MSEDTLLLGPAPRPDTDECLTTALGTAIAGLMPPGVTGLTSTTVTATLAGSDIDTLSLDLTGVAVTTFDDQLGNHELPQAEAVTGEPATVRTLTIAAHPLTIAGARVTVQGRAENVPITWVETNQGLAGLQFPEPNDPSKPVTGEGSASVAKGELQQAALVIGRDLAQLVGVTLETLTLDLEQSSPQVLQVAADARVKKGFIGANAHVNGTVTLDNQTMTATVSNLSVGSKNPVINALLGAVKGRIDRYNNTAIAINDRLPGGVKLTHAEVRVTDQVIVTGRIG